MTECKYKLTCGWCDKFDKECDGRESNYKQHKKIHLQECNHDWQMDYWYMEWSEEKQRPFRTIVFSCKKCGKYKEEIEYMIERDEIYETN